MPHWVPTVGSRWFLPGYAVGADGPYSPVVVLGIQARLTSGWDVMVEDVSGEAWTVAGSVWESSHARPATTVDPVVVVAG